MIDGTMTKCTDYHDTKLQLPLKFQMLHWLFKIHIVVKRLIHVGKVSLLQKSIHCNGRLPPSLCRLVCIFNSQNKSPSNWQTKKCQPKFNGAVNTHTHTHTLYLQL